MPNPGTGLNPAAASAPPERQQLSSPTLTDAAYRAAMTHAIQAASSPGTPKDAIALVHHALEAGLCIDALSPVDVMESCGVQRRTAQSILSWCRRHNLLSHNNLDDSRRNLRHGCSVPIEQEKNSCTNNIHKAKICAANPDKPVWDLAIEKLDAIGFMTLPGPKDQRIPWPRRSDRLVAWIERWGIDAVLHALWLAQSPRKGLPIRNQAGFVKSRVEAGHTPPDGWRHPTLMNQDAMKALKAPQAAFNQPSGKQGLEYPGGSYQPLTNESDPILPHRNTNLSSDVEFEPVLAALRREAGRLFEKIHLKRGDGKRVIVQSASRFVIDWAKDKQEAITCALEAEMGMRPGLVFMAD